MSALADAILTVANILFMISALPPLCNEDAAVPRWQSSMTAVALVMVSVANALLGVYFAAATVLISAIEWGAIFVLRPVKDNGRE